MATSRSIVWAPRSSAGWGFASWELPRQVGSNTTRPICAALRPRATVIRSGFGSSSNFRCDGATMCRRAALAVLLLLSPTTPGSAEPGTDRSIAATPQVLRDLMIQNVCVDAAGAMLPGRSPLDDGRLCPGQRDLRPGEPLPYHKHDHPSPDQRRDAPLGYQRHD